MKIKFKKIVLSLLVFCCSSSVVQAEFDQSVAIMGGTTVWDFEAEEYYDVVAPSFKFTSELALDDTNTKFEMAIFSLGGIENNAGFGDTITVRGFSLGFVQPLISGESASLRGKLGISWTSSDAIYPDNEEYSFSHANLFPFVGLGIEIAILDDIALRAEYELYRIDIGSSILLHTMLVGVVFSFDN